MFPTLAVAIASQPLPCFCSVGECAQLDFLSANPWLCVRSQRHDVHVVGAIKRDGLWERHIVREVYRALKKEPGTLFLDVGAHIGQYTTIAAASGFPVVSFEANPENCDYLRSSLAANNVSHRVLVIPNPVLGAAGIRTSFRNAKEQKDNTGGWAIQHDTRGSMLSTTIDTEMLRLDPEEYTSIVMKVDIEGSEPQALAGAMHTLQHTRTIFMEWGMGGEEKREMARNLARMGLRVTDYDCEHTDFATCPWDVQFVRGGKTIFDYSGWVFIVAGAVCTGTGIFAVQLFKRSRIHRYYTATE